MKSILIACLIFPLSLFAGPGGGADVGGGGNGIIRGKHVYLQDLFESGIVNEPFLMTHSPLFEKALAKMTWVDEITRMVLASKIAVINREDSLLANATVKALLAYQWSLVDSKLVTIESDSVTHETLVQLAIRMPLQVYISKSLWNRMAPSHRAGLLLHEVLSALRQPETPLLRVRQFVGALFTENSERGLPPTIQHEIRRSWPSLSRFSTIAEPMGIRGQAPQRSYIQPTRHGCTTPICEIMPVNLENWIPGDLSNWDRWFFPMVYISDTEGSGAAWVRPETQKQINQIICTKHQSQPLKLVYFMIHELSVEPLSETDKNLPFLKVKLQSIGLATIDFASKDECSHDDIQQLEQLNSFLNQ